VNWDDFLTEQDKSVFGAGGYGSRMGLGDRPVVLVVDVTYGFCGDRREPILDSVRRWRSSCGEAAWDALPHVATLCAAARQRDVPVVYTHGAPRRADGLDRGRWADKNRRQAQDPPQTNEILTEVAPAPADVVIAKEKPSAFFGTPLASYLVALGADSLIVCGTTTSGCVRASVVDAFSLNYRVAIAAEATFDRGQASHWINLFDMDMKYADVLGMSEILDYLGRVA
jgi:maleamate amidohydrolase